MQSRIKALARRRSGSSSSATRARVRFRFPQPERTSDDRARAAWRREVVRSDRTVYRGLDFVLRRGEKTVLVGPNGAGKSTLLKLLAGAVAPDAGERRARRLRVSIGYYTQHRHDMLDLDATVLENAMRAARAAERDLRAHAARRLPVLAATTSSKQASVLSGGEKSRLALAMILLDPPSVLLMDEPTIHLDIASVDALIARPPRLRGCALLRQPRRPLHPRSWHGGWCAVENGALTDYPGDWDYYCWKRDQAATGASERPVDVAENVAAEQRSGRRDARRRAAEARTAFAKRTRAVRLELTQLETAIDQLERERAGLEATLADPELYERGGADVARAGRRHAETERELETAMERWTELSSTLEAEELAFHGHGESDLDSTEDA